MFLKFKLYVNVNHKLCNKIHSLLRQSFNKGEPVNSLSLLEFTNDPFYAPPMRFFGKNKCTFVRILNWENYNILRTTQF